MLGEIILFYLYPYCAIFRTLKVSRNLEAISTGLSWIQQLKDSSTPMSLECDISRIQERKLKGKYYEISGTQTLYLSCWNGIQKKFKCRSKWRPIFCKVSKLCFIQRFTQHTLNVICTVIKMVFIRKIVYRSFFHYVLY